MQSTQVLRQSSPARRRRTLYSVALPIVACLAFRAAIKRIPRSRARTLYGVVLPVVTLLALCTLAKRIADLRTYTSSKRRSSKMALLIGIEYAAQGQNGLLPALGPLGLPHKHTRELRDVLEAYGFDVILMLDDPDTPRHLYPNKKNILEQIDLLTLGARSSDKLVFVYSGHGAQRDSEIPGDEEDDKDECILPADWCKEGDEIRDNELHQFFVNRVPMGARMFALFDSCHSGTILDLKHTWRFDPGTRWLKGRRSYPARSLFENCCDAVGLSALFAPRSEIICFSAAIDCGLAYEHRKRGFSFLHFFTQILGSGPTKLPVSVGDAFAITCQNHADALARCPINHEKQTPYDQQPQLSSNDPNFNLNVWLRRFFSTP